MVSCSNQHVRYRLSGDYPFHQTNLFEIGNNREMIFENQYLLANPIGETYKINISLWNAHKDPIFGHTKFVHNWTIQEVIVEYAIVDFINNSTELWILNDGRKCFLLTLFYYFSPVKKQQSISSPAAFAVQLLMGQIDHPTQPQVTCSWGDGTRNSPDREYFNNTGLGSSYQFLHFYARHNHYTYQCNMSNHVSEMNFTKDVSSNKIIPHNSILLYQQFLFYSSWNRSQFTSGS